MFIFKCLCICKIQVSKVYLFIRPSLKKANALSKIVLWRKRRWRDKKSRKNAALPRGMLEIIWQINDDAMFKKKMPLSGSFCFYTSVDS